MAQTKVKLISDGVIVQGNLHASHGITTAHIGEGSNLYYTDARVGSYLSTNSFATESYVGTQIANLVDSSPATLNTLNELAAALGDDPNFATTTANSIGTKLPLAGGTLTGGLTGTTAGFSGSITASGNSNSFGNTTIAALSASTGTFSASVTAAGNSNSFGATTFSDRITAQNGITVTGGATGADIYINNTSPTLGFTDTNSFTDANDIYIIRGASNGSLQFQWYDNSAGTTTQTFIIDSSGNATFAGDVVANGAIQTLASNANLTISGDTSGNVYYNNTAGEHRWRANGSSVNSMTLSSSLLTVNENATFSGNVAVIGSAKFIEVGSANTGTNFGFIGWNAASKYLFIGNSYNSAYNEDIIINSSGNVGIGTTSPSTQIHNLQKTNNRAGGFYTQLQGNAYGLSMFVNSGGYGIIGSNGTFTTDVLTMDLNSGNVGIGTTSPTEKLEVNGVIQIKRIGDHPAIRFVEDTTTRGYIGTGDWAVNGGADADLGISSAGTGSLILGTNSGNGRVYIVNGGKVGIGTTSPSAQLHLYNAGAGGTPMLQVMSHATAAGSFTGNYMAEFCHAFSGVNHTMLVKNNETDGGRRTLDVADGNGIFATFTNGKVGIGTTSPTSQLHIKNTSGDNRGVLVDNTVAASYAEVSVKSNLREFRLGTGGSGTNNPRAQDMFYIYDATTGGAAGHRFEIRSDGQLGSTVYKSIGGSADTLYTTLNNEIAGHNGNGMKYLGQLNIRDGSRYLDVALNTASNNIMFYIYVKGFLYNRGMYISCKGGYTYSGSIINVFGGDILDSGIAKDLNVYRGTNSTAGNYSGNLCFRIDSGSNGYSEGMIEIYLGTHSTSLQNALKIHSYAQNDTSNYYFAQ